MTKRHVSARQEKRLGHAKGPEYEIWRVANQGKIIETEDPTATLADVKQVAIAHQVLLARNPIRTILIWDAVETAELGCNIVNMPQDLQDIAQHAGAKILLRIWKLRNL